MRRDDRIIVMGEDVAGGGGRGHLGLIDAWGGPFGVTRGLIQEFGEQRVRDTPISESAFIGAAVGLAAEGYRPWVDIMFSELLAVAWDQITNRMARARYLTAGQGTFAITLKTFGECYAPVCHYPGLIAVAPSDPYTAKGLMIAAIREDNPVVVFDSLSLLRAEMEVPDEAYITELGKLRIVRPGSDITLLGIGPSTRSCISAAALLADRGIQVEVADLLTLVPWDVEGLVESVGRTRRLLIVDFDHPSCSLSSDIAATMGHRLWDHLMSPPVRINPPAVPAMQMDSNPAMARMYNVSVERICEAVTTMLASSVRR